MQSKWNLWFLLSLSLPLYAQMGSGQAYGTSLDVSGNVIDGVVVGGNEVGPTPLVQLVDQMTSDTQSSSLVNVDLMGYESMPSSNIVTVSTAYDATLGGQSHLSQSDVSNADILINTLVVGNLVTITATDLTSQAMVSGACGGAGNGDLVESGTTSVSDLNVSILGISVVSNLSGSAFTSIDLSMVSGLDILGVTGTLTVNRVTLVDGGATGTGSAEAVALELSLQAGSTALGLGNTASADLTLGFSDASRDCNSLAVELLSFTVE